MDKEKEEILAAVSRFLFEEPAAEKAIDYLEQSKEDTYDSVSDMFIDIYYVDDGENLRHARLIMVIAWLLSKEDTKFYSYHSEEEPLNLSKEEHELFKRAAFLTVATKLFTASYLKEEPCFRQMFYSIKNKVGLKVFLDTELQMKIRAAELLH